MLEPGMLSSLQDGGRRGHAHLGIGRAGAADLPAMQLANALVGNRRDACVIELTLLGPRLRLHRAATVAITGAPLPQARCDDAELPMWRSVRCEAESELDLGGMPTGCRSYLAVDGGIDVEPWLGSRSSDINAGVGAMQGSPLKSGDSLPLGTPLKYAPMDTTWSLDPRPWFEHSNERSVLRLLPGSHTNALEPDSRDALVAMASQVDADSNRVGVRLRGEEKLRLAQPLELISEGVVPGVMQLPPGGQPIILGCEHPVTGGYPRIAQLVAVDLPRLAQCRPGDTVHFSWISIPEASHALAEQMQGLERLCADIARRLEQHT